MNSQEEKVQIAIGLFVTLAFVILVGGIMWGKEVSLFSKRLWLTARFDNLRGLERGDPVVVRGIPMGEVSSISLQDYFVEVRLWIKRDVTLFSDFQIVIESRELMGGKQIGIDPGSSRESADLQHIYYGKNQGDPISLMNTIERTLSQVDSVINRIKDFMENQQLDQMVHNMNQTTDEVREMFTENRQSIRSVLNKLDMTLQQFQKDSVVVRLTHLVMQIDTTVTLMKQIGLNLESEEGSLGKFIQDKSLYEQLLKTTIRMDSLVMDIKANPKRYIHVSLF